MSDIFQEITQELKQEKILSLWKKYQVFVYGLVAFIIITTSVMVIFSNNSQKIDNEAAANYYAALVAIESNNLVFAEEKLQTILNSKSKGYKLLAYLQQAALKIKDKKYDEANEIYNKIIDISNNKNISDLAIFNQTLLRLNNNQASAEELSKFSNNFYTPLLLELEILSAINKQDFDLAKQKIDEALSKQNLPDNLYNRIQLFQNLISTNTKNKNE